MYKINLNQKINVHFIGIGGISMSGLAEILIKKGFTISGSDVNHNKNTQKLKNLGATIYLGHRTKQITSDIDLIVYTVAVHADNPELVEGHKQHIPIIDRGSLLGQIMQHYKNSIGVAGTHGKTTTTSMLAHILFAGDTDPTITVGGILPLIDGNIAVGQSHYFVTEACEYYDSFHHFYPKIGIILNIEEDHLDYFTDIHHIRHSFNQYLKNVDEDGIIIFNGNILDTQTVLKDIKTKIRTFSLVDPSCHLYATNITYNALGYPRFDVFENNTLTGHYELSVPGDHNVSNALATILTSRYLNIDEAAIYTGLKAFTGTHRRFQYKGSLGGVNIIDDYAHHPTEIRATINATKHMDFNKLWIVFQPHTFSRTKTFLDEFAKALSLADYVILLDIYSANREVDYGDIHSKDLESKINMLQTPCIYLSSFDEISYHILTHCVPNDLLITMGAGDVYLLGEYLLDT